MSIEIDDCSRRYTWGAHISRSGSLKSSIEEALKEMPMLQAVQVYIANPRGFGTPKISATDALETSKLVKYEDIKFYIHASLLYNLCGSTDSTDAEHTLKFRRNISHLAQELDIGALSGCSGVVVHIGSCKNSKFGCECIKRAVKEAVTCESPITAKLSRETGISVAEIISRRKLLLENCAGEGTKIGATLDDIVPLYTDAPCEKVGICWDTAHSFGAGVYNLSQDKSALRMKADIERTGARIELFHLNDSAVPFGKRADRHANLGMGLQFQGGMSSEFVSQWGSIPLIAECPDSPLLDWMWLKSLE